MYGKGNEIRTKTIKIKVLQNTYSYNRSLLPFLQQRAILLSFRAHDTERNIGICFEFRREIQPSRGYEKENRRKNCNKKKAKYTKKRWEKRIENRIRYTKRK